MATLAGDCLCLLELELDPLLDPDPEPDLALSGLSSFRSSLTPEPPGGLVLATLLPLRQILQRCDSHSGTLLVGAFVTVPDEAGIAGLLV